MFQIGDKVTGKFVRVTTYRDRQPDLLLSHVSGALFDIGGGKWAKLPISHALDQYSDRMTRRRLVRLQPGAELSFEIIDINSRAGKTFVTISDKVRAARELMDAGKKLWTVTVTQSAGHLGKGIEVCFPAGEKFRIHKAWLGVDVDSVRAGQSLIVKPQGISLCDGPWFFHIGVVDPKRYPDHEVIGQLPTALTLAAELASGAPDLAADFIRHITSLDLPEET